jgi:DNA-binding MarR family transcriptional regulator
MSIIPLISSWEQYILTHPAGDLRDFGRWLQLNPSTTSRPSSTPEPASPHATPTTAKPTPFIPVPPAVLQARQSLATNLNLDASAVGTLLISRLGQINQFLSKPVIRDMGFTKDVEFGVLVQVLLMDRPNKKELCRQLLIENSTGVEITRRLAKKGLLRETIDPSDRRSARLNVTEKGQRLLKEGYTKLSTIHTDFLHPLPVDQQQQLVSLLTRLNEYHSARVLKAVKRT